MLSLDIEEGEMKMVNIENQQQQQQQKQQQQHQQQKTKWTAKLLRDKQTVWSKIPKMFLHPL